MMHTNREIRVFLPCQIFGQAATLDILKAKVMSPAICLSNMNLGRLFMIVLTPMLQNICKSLNFFVIVLNGHINISINLQCGRARLSLLMYYKQY